jgi:hypothetical protein
MKDASDDVLKPVEWLGDEFNIVMGGWVDNKNGKSLA